MNKQFVIEQKETREEQQVKEDIKAAVTNTIETIQKNPKAANVFFKANTELVEGVSCTAQIGNFPLLVVDEKPEMGGKNTSPNPVELLLVALGTCQEIMYSTYASMMGVNLDSVKVSLKGDIDLKGMLGLDENTPSGFNKISFKTNIESDADEETLINLIEAVEEHCPVMDTLLREVIVSGSAAVNGKELFRSVAKKARL